MNKKLLIILVVVILFGLGVLIFNIIGKAVMEETDSKCFEFNEETGEITGYKDICGTEIRIPSEIEGVKVVSIGKFVFDEKNLTKLILPDTLQTIGIGAFQNNGIKELIIPDSVINVKALAFYSNKIEKLTIGKGVVNIGIEAFNNNQLKRKDAFIYMRDQNGMVDGTVVGYGGAERDNVIVPDDVTMLYLSALADCNIKEITLNDKLERIESSSLSNNKLTEITIPESVIIVGQNAFLGNDLDKIIINGKDSLDDFSLFDVTGIDKKIIEFEK